MTAPVSSKTHPEISAQNLDELSLDVVTLQEKPWESSLLDFPVYQLHFRSAGKEADAALIKESLRRIGDRFSETRALLCTRLAATEGVTVRALEEAGFHLMECYLTLRHSLNTFLKNPAMADIEVATEADIPLLRDIAAESFQYSRFHMDPHIGREKAALTRSEWVENAVKDAGKTVLLVRHEGEIAGFVCIRIKADREKTGILDLIAVSPRSQGHGLGRALTQACLDHCLQAECRSVEVGTQAHNISSMRLYEAAGFRLIGATYSYHKHTGLPNS